MGHDRKSKVIAIVALCVGVAGLAIGFAAFSNILRIGANVTVRPDAQEFKVRFVEPFLTCETTGGAQYNGDSNNHIEYNNETGDSYAIQLNPSVTFTSEGTVTCKGYVKNLGKYVAYLNAVTSEGTITCSSYGTNSITEKLLDAACSTISATVSVGKGETTDHVGEIVTETVTSSQAISYTEINGHYLDLGSVEPVEYTISYTADQTQNVIVDGAFNVQIPLINIIYEAVDVRTES